MSAITDQIKQKGGAVGEFWKNRPGKQKWIIIGTFAFLVIFLSVFIFIASRPQYVPLYSGTLSTREVGDIRAELDKQGITNYQITANGTMIEVPKKDAASITVNLASKGYPKDSSINYDVFSQNLSFGMTERQFSTLERQAMQTQVGEVLTNIQGIDDAIVTLTLPDKQTFVSQDNQSPATASVVVKIAPGTELGVEQVRALYKLVSGAVPKLTVDHISIVDQYGQPYDYPDANKSGASFSDYAEHRSIQKDVQNDIQQSLRGMLGTILGMDNVIVQATVKMNFDKVNSVEDNVTPVNAETGKGLEVSEGTHTITSTGSSIDGGNPPSGETDAVGVPTYSATTTSGDSLYSEVEIKKNYDYNKVHKTIESAPYVIEDISINVGVQPDDPKSKRLSKATEDSIKQMVSNTILTALGHPKLSAAEMDQRITVYPQTFVSSEQAASTSVFSNTYVVAGGSVGLILVIGAIVWLIISRKRKREEEEEDFDPFSQFSPGQPDFGALEDREPTMEEQLLGLLDERPEDFAKIIRTWINEGE